MSHQDTLTAPAGLMLPFVFDNLPVRGFVLRLKQLDHYLPALKENDGAVSTMLGEMLALSVTLVSDLKFDAAVSLQIHNSSGVLVAQCDKNGGMRASASLPKSAQSYQDIVGSEGAFVVNIKQRGELYQSLVALDDTSVAASAEAYFNDSVQLDTYFRVSANGGEVGAIFLQRLPESDFDRDDWHRLGLILETLTPAELQPGNLNEKQLLGRLFPEETVRVFDVRDLTISLPNMKARMEKAIASMGVPQVQELLEEGPLIIACEFSGVEHTFDEAAVRAIFGTLWDEQAG